MTITFDNVKKISKEEEEKIRFWKAVFGPFEMNRTWTGIEIKVDGRKHLWRRKNLNDNCLYNLLKSKSESVSFK